MWCFSSTSCVVPLVLLSSVVVAQEATAVRKLNAQLDTELSGDVRYTRLSADGEWAVYLADLEQDEVFDLYSVRTVGSSAPNELAGPISSSPAGFLVAPDSTRVLYQVGWNLFSVAIDGSGAPEQLTALPAFARCSIFLVSADSSHALYIADQEVDGRFELFAVAMDASSAPFKLSEPAGLAAVNGLWIEPAGGAALYTMSLGMGSLLFRASLAGGPPVQLTADGVFEQHLRAASDGSRALYYSHDWTGTHDYLLQSVPLDGSVAPLALASDDSSPHLLELSPDSSRVVYTFDDATLYSTLADGSGIVSSVTSYLRNEAFRISADSTRVVFLRGYAGNVTGLASRVIDASQPDVRLDASDTVREFAIGSTIAVYRAHTSGVSSGDDQLFAAPLDGSAAPVRLDVGAGDVTGFTLAPDALRVAYTKGGDLFLVPTSAATPPVLLASRGATPLFTPTRVVFEAVNDEQANELFTAPLAGGASTRLSLPFANEWTVDDVRRVDAHGRWAALQIGQGTVEDELWCARLDAPTSAFRIEGPRVSNVGNGGFPWGVAISSAMDRLVYHADGGTLQTVALDSSPVTEALPGPTVATPNGAVPFLLDPFETRAVYRDTAGGLRCVPIDGSGPAELLAANCEFGFQISSDSQRVVYRAISSGRFRLFSVPMDASAPAVQLSPGTLNVSVGEFHLSPDGDDVAFEAGGLYGAAADGSAGAVLLNPTVNVLYDRFVTFGVTANGTVVYLDGEPEDLYAVPLDGSASPVRLSHASGSARIQQFELTPDGTRVAYTARHGGAQPRMLSAPMDGSAEPLNLSTVPPVLFTPFELSPDGTRVLFQASLARLYSARLDVAESAVPLYPTPPGGSNVYAFRFLPGSQRVLFVSDGAAPGRFELYATSSRGGVMPLKLSAPLVAGGDVSTSKVLPTEHGFAYVADADEDEVFELYLATLRDTAAVKPPSASASTQR